MSPVGALSPISVPANRYAEKPAPIPTRSRFLHHPNICVYPRIAKPIAQRYSYYLSQVPLLRIC